MTPFVLARHLPWGTSSSKSGKVGLYPVQLAVSGYLRRSLRARGAIANWLGQIYSALWLGLNLNVNFFVLFIDGFASPSTQVGPFIVRGMG